MNAKTQELLREHHEQEEHWLSVSDLMAVLMMIFLLIAVIYMVKVEIEASKIREVAVLYDHLKTELYEDLLAEFEEDLPKWGAELEPDLTIRFKEPDVLFDRGKADLKPHFKTILDDFFPRYVGIITSDKYRNDVVELRIEGHTSSVWSRGTTPEKAYILNMALSQERTRSTLQYLLQVPPVRDEVNWLREHATANGLSSSKRVMENGVENYARSRRVEFRVKTDAEAQIARILQVSD